MTAAKRKPSSEFERRDTPRSGSFDFHASDPRAWGVLLSVERQRLRRFHYLHEMACGDGALVAPMRASGFKVLASDIVDRGCPDSSVFDFLDWAEPVRARLVAGITNPPYSRCEEFVITACERFDYVAMLLRLRYLAPQHLICAEGKPSPKAGLPLWQRTRIPFARLILPPARFRPMHREGYAGKKTDNSMIDFAWFVFDRDHRGAPEILRAEKTADWGGDFETMTVGEPT